MKAHDQEAALLVTTTDVTKIELRQLESKDLLRLAVLELARIAAQLEIMTGQKIRDEDLERRI